MPREGEIVGFDEPGNGVMPLQVSGFMLHLAVEKILHPPFGGHVSAALADVVLASQDDAGKLFRYMEDGFGLYADEYGHIGS